MEGWQPSETPSASREAEKEVNNMPIPKTLKDAYDNGYRITETKHVRGYLSRKIDDYDQPVKIAGGIRKGQLYVELPSFASSTYHYRCYLTKPIDK